MPFNSFINISPQQSVDAGETKYYSSSGFRVLDFGSDTLVSILKFCKLPKSRQQETIIEINLPQVKINKQKYYVLTYDGLHVLFKTSTIMDDKSAVTLYDIFGDSLYKREKMDGHIESNTKKHISKQKKKDISVSKETGEDKDREIDQEIKQSIMNDKRVGLDSLIIFCNTSHLDKLFNFEIPKFGMTVVLNNRHNSDGGISISQLAKLMVKKNCKFQMSQSLSSAIIKYTLNQATKENKTGIKNEYNYLEYNKLEQIIVGVKLQITNEHIKNIKLHVNNLQRSNNGKLSRIQKLFLIALYYAHISGTNKDPNNELLKLISSYDAPIVYNESNNVNVGTVSIREDFTVNDYIPTVSELKEIAKSRNKLTDNHGVLFKRNLLE